MLPLADELEFLHDFLSLEETRYSGISLLCAMASTQKLVAPAYQLLIGRRWCSASSSPNTAWPSRTRGALVLLQIVAGLFPLAAAVYVNHYLLIPQLLHAPRTGWYWASLAALPRCVSLIYWFYPYFPFAPHV